MKRIIALGSIICMLSLFTVPAYAGLTEVEMTSGTSMYNWDPDVYQVKIDNDIPGAIRMVSYFKWTDITNFPKYENKEYYTHEHYDFNDSGHATIDDMYSNLPYAHFDVDDDFDSPTFGEEELEVTCANETSSTPVLKNGT